MTNWKTDPVTQRTISALRRDSLTMAEGHFMGPEDELVARYGVSRPTLRLAAAIVSQEQLIKVRRGVNGGYFAARPTVEAVARVAAIYLETRETGPDDLMAAALPIRMELARLAAQSTDPTLAAKLRELLDEDQAYVTAVRDEATLPQVRAESRFWALLGAASGNKVLQLFIEILIDLGLAGPNARTPRSLKVMMDRRVEVARAILNHDPELAAQAARKSTFNLGRAERRDADAKAGAVANRRRRNAGPG